jgi:hypothetical protein
MKKYFKSFIPKGEMKTKSSTIEFKLSKEKITLIHIFITLNLQAGLIIGLKTRKILQTSFTPPTIHLF